MQGRLEKLKKRLKPCIRALKKLHQKAGETPLSVVAKGAKDYFKAFLLLVMLAGFKALTFTELKPQAVYHSDEDILHGTLIIFVSIAMFRLVVFLMSEDELFGFKLSAAKALCYISSAGLSAKIFSHMLSSPTLSEIGLSASLGKEALASSAAYIITVNYPRLKHLGLCLRISPSICSVD